MATTPRKGRPYTWVSWLTGLLSGSAQCQWALWYKSHFQYDKRITDFNLDAWTVQHNALVDQRKRELELDGYAVKVEDENWFRLTGQQAVLAGKPDLMATLGPVRKILDGKSGNSSKRDWWQMLIYLWAIPLAWNRPIRFVGEVFYPSGPVEVLPEELTPSLKQRLVEVIHIASATDPPPRTPSFKECNRCEILDCPDRISEADNVQGSTEEF